MRNPQTINLKGGEYVIVPKTEYLRLVSATPSVVPRGSVDAVEYARTSLARDLRSAREEAGLTQAELAKRMRKSQALVARSESGSIHIGERYFQAVLKACGLPATWEPTKTALRIRRRRGPAVKKSYPRAGS